MTSYRILLGLTVYVYGYKWNYVQASPYHATHRYNALCFFVVSCRTPTATKHRTRTFWVWGRRKNRLRIGVGRVGLAAVARRLSPSQTRTQTYKGFGCDNRYFSLGCLFHANNNVVTISTDTQKQQTTDKTP